MAFLGVKTIGGWKFRRALVAIALPACVAVSGFDAPPADSTPVTSTGYVAAPIPIPTGYSAGATTTEANAVSCPPTGPCVAVGQVAAEGSSDYTATVSTAGTGGAFGQSTVVGPAGSVFEGLSCSASGSCTAVGTTYSGSTEDSIADTMSGGTFGTPLAVTLPTGAVAGGINGLSSVACSSPGNCIAVGYFETSPGTTTGMVATQSNGTFSPAVAVAAPLGTTTSELESVSCASANNCTAVGSYSNGGATEPLTVAIVGGTALTGQSAPLPEGATAGNLTSVACWNTTDCLAVGEVGTRSLTEPYAVSAIAGVFNAPSVLGAPPELDTNATATFDDLTGVSCTPAGNCIVVGNYNNQYLGTQSSIYTESGGVFSGPSGVQTAGYATFDLAGVDCGTNDNCAIVGSDVVGGNGNTTPDTAVYVNTVSLTTPTLVTTATGQETYNYNQGITDTATLSGGAGVLGGDLLFEAYEPTDPMCDKGAVNGIEPVPVSGDGTYVSPTVYTAGGAGTYNWVVIYSGDDGNQQVISPCGAAGEQSVVHMAMSAETALENAEIGQMYTGDIQASGGTLPYTYALTSGDLPAGLTLGSNGTISGTPNDPPEAGGDFDFSVTATDAIGATGVGSYSIYVELEGSPPVSHGYWLVGSDGGIFSYGSAQFYGSAGRLKLNRPVVGIAPTATRTGYWLVAADGGIFSYGSTQFYGSLPQDGYGPAGSSSAKPLAAPIVAMVPSADDGGYFMVGSDGGVFAFGDATFAGSCPSIGGCSGAAVAVIPDATGNGYWLVTVTGHVYAFGDAINYGQPGPEFIPITSAVRTPDGQGYWILYANGVIVPYGDAGSFGSPAGLTGGSNPATAIFATSTGNGYWVATANGMVYNYGDAPAEGGASSLHLNGSIVAASGS
jgi:hypothetical protein